MAFLSPLWLLTLIPWAALTAWLLRGRRLRVWVPFLDLWRGPVPLEIPKGGWHVPPAWLLFLVVAMLLAVLGASRPVTRNSKLSADHPITVIVDRGITMSALEAGAPRFRAVAGRAAQEMNLHLPPGTPVQLIPVPGDVQHSDVRGWVQQLDGLSPTAIDTSEILLAIAREELARSDGPVVLITDRPIDISNDRLFQIGPSQLQRDVAIVRMAASQSPAAQVMVRLRNDSARSRSQIRITSAGRSVDRTVDLPPIGQERDYFFDMDRLDATVMAELTEADDQPANDRAWLAREGSNPRIEIRAPVPPEVQRMIEVFTRARPPMERSPVVVVVGSFAEIHGDQPAIVVASATLPSTARGEVVVADHPVNSQVNWKSLSDDLRVAGDSPSGWVPIVSTGAITIVSLKSEPIRRVWVGFDARGWAGTTDFVVFWANVLQWVANGGQERYVAKPLSDFQDGWKQTSPPAIFPLPADGQWPGIYQASDGTQHALNAPPVRPSIVQPTGSLEKLSDLQNPSTQNVQFAPMLLLMATACMAGAALTWRDRSGSDRRSLS